MAARRRSGPEPPDPGIDEISPTWERRSLRSGAGATDVDVCRSGQEEQLGAVGLVVNAIALFNTRYMDRAVTHVRDTGKTVRDADVERLSPLVRDHIELHGRYSFELPDVVRDASSVRFRNLKPDEILVPLIRERLIPEPSGGSRVVDAQSL